MPRVFRSLLLLAICLLSPVYAVASEPWPKVPDADFGKIKLDDFSDHELEVPIHLFHFARVANAVVETGEHRGFLDLAVNRDPKDNRPYNARIMEMQMVLAYFYGADRPWNPYRAHPAVRARLEAMLTRWTKIQRDDGLFAEYSPDNYSLAPTNFGAMAAAQTLEILHESRAPLDAEGITAARASLRSALVAIFTREDMRRHARQWSNQFTGSYYAALAYLRVGADPEIERLLVRAVEAASAEDQSPAGFLYEQGGPDFGYTGVHDNNLRVAWPLLRDRPALTRPVLEADVRWSRWLGYNLVLQPGTENAPVFLTNAGINTRTSHALQTPKSLPLAELVPEARPFALTPEERARALADRRRSLAQNWGAWPALRVPNAHAYSPAFVYGAWRPLDDYGPSTRERAAALAAMPWRKSTRFNHQLHDAWPLTVTLARRPTYYAAFNSGRIRVPRQSYGLGLLWNDRFGVALQAVSGTPWSVGTRADGAAQPYEQRDLAAKVQISSGTVTPRAGMHALRDGDLRITHPLGDTGNKTITFAESRVSVELTHRGAFSEQLPLVVPDGAAVESRGSRLIMRRSDGAEFHVETRSSGATLTLGEPQALGSGLTRRMLTITARDALRYDLSFR
ncbi:MAG: hypothetical protein MUE42_01550 [Opitutaceae bacterium]|jgi:hypothetical protein|nr:hypothetical protein [Opitutaceae bacterium]